MYSFSILQAVVYVCVIGPYTIYRLKMAIIPYITNPEVDIQQKPP